MNFCCTETPRASSIHSSTLENIFLALSPFGTSSSLLALMTFTVSSPAYFTSNEFGRSWTRPPKPRTRKLSKSAWLLHVSYTVTCSRFGSYKRSLLSANNTSFGAGVPFRVCTSANISMFLPLRRKRILPVCASVAPITHVNWSHWKSAVVVRKFAAAVSIFLRTVSSRSLSLGGGVGFAGAAAAGLGSGFDLAATSSALGGVFLSGAAAVFCAPAAQQKTNAAARNPKLRLSFISFSLQHL